ncbi:MAG: PQQ-binding-like beta-propeller repeat protein [Planctomycetota bacterium]
MLFPRLAANPRTFLAVVLVLFHATSGFSQWHGWRGPDGDNHAADDARLPGTWNLATGENIAWKTPIPGRGHSTPIVTEKGIFLTTADRLAGTQSVIGIDPESGAVFDSWVIHRDELPNRIHPNNSYASPSIAYDGETLYAAFHTTDAVSLTAMSTDGRIRWTSRVCEFKPTSFQFGYGASPLIHHDLVIVAAEYDGKDSGIYAIDRRTGKRVWKVDRPSNLNFASPILATIAGQEQLLIAGADAFSSYDPATGRQLWEVGGSTEAICGTVAWDNRHVVVSGGNPKPGTWCIAADGRARLQWSNNVMCYEQSLLAIKNHVFAVADNGVAYCWRIEDGKEMWKKRLFGGGISASPLLVGNRIVVASERGDVFVLAASPDRFELISKIKTGDSIFASPVAIGDRLYIRAGVREGRGRQEYLVAIGDK